MQGADLEGRLEEAQEHAERQQKQLVQSQDRVKALSNQLTDAAAIEELQGRRHEQLLHRVRRLEEQLVEARQGRERDAGRLRELAAAAEHEATQCGGLQLRLQELETRNAELERRLALAAQPGSDPPSGSAGLGSGEPWRSLPRGGEAAPHGRGHCLGVAARSSFKALLYSTDDRSETCGTVDSFLNKLDGFEDQLADALHDGPSPAVARGLPAGPFIAVETYDRSPVAGASCGSHQAFRSPVDGGLRQQLAGKVEQWIGRAEWRLSRLGADHLALLRVALAAWRTEACRRDCERELEDSMGGEYLQVQQLALLFAARQHDTTALRAVAAMWLWAWREAAALQRRVGQMLSSVRRSDADALAALGSEAIALLLVASATSGAAFRLWRKAVVGSRLCRRIQPWLSAALTPPPLSDRSRLAEQRESLLYAVWLAWGQATESGRWAHELSRLRGHTVGCMVRLQALTAKGDRGFVLFVVFSAWCAFRRLQARAAQGPTLAAGGRGAQVVQVHPSGGASQRSCFLAWRVALRLQALRCEVWAWAGEAQRQHGLVDLLSAGYAARLALLEGWSAWKLACWMALAGLGGRRSAALRRPFAAWRAGVVQQRRRGGGRLVEAEAESCRETLLLALCCGAWKEATLLTYLENQGTHWVRLADQRLDQAEALAASSERHALVLQVLAGWREACSDREAPLPPASPGRLAEGERTQTSLQTQTPMQTPIRTEDHATWLASVLEATGGTVPKEYPPAAAGLPSMLRGLARAASVGSCANGHDPCGPLSGGGPGLAATASAEFDKAGSAWSDLHCKRKALWCAQADLQHFGLVVAGLEAQLQC